MSTFKGLTFGFRGQITNTWNLFTNYTFSYSYNDTDGAFSLPANNYDLASEWGRAGNDTRNRFIAGLNGRLPGNLNVTTLTRVFSGRPYNITTGFDNYNDGQTNARPAGVARNSAQGPSDWDATMNVSRTVSLFKHERDAQLGGFPGGPPGGGGFPGGGPGGGGGGGFLVAAVQAAEARREVAGRAVPEVDREDPAVVAVLAVAAGHLPAGVAARASPARRPSFRRRRPLSLRMCKTCSITAISTTRAVSLPRRFSVSRRRRRQHGLLNSVYV